MCISLCVTSRWKRIPVAPIDNLSLLLKSIYSIIIMDSLIHRALKGEKLSEIPFWFMRQAGRYLPEYREIRAKAGSFLDLCYNPVLASEVTLQPVKRFDMSAAILFSDILVIPHAMGIKVTFENGEGPKLSVTRDLKSAERLNFNNEHLHPVIEAVGITRSQLDKSKSLIGFCGAPWTVACYMVEGGGSRDYEFTRSFAMKEPETFSLIIRKLIESSVTYLSMQVKAGVDIIQIFDSWAGVLSEREYTQWVIEPAKKIVSQMKALHPDIPIIGFPRGSGVKYTSYAEETGVDAVSIDVTTPMVWARDNIKLPLQGNLNPVLLMQDKDTAIEETRNILHTMRDRPFIFNLGHGILQHTPLENVQAVCELVKNSRR